MTSLAVTLSVDARGPCAIYIITDSRITWDRASVRWDGGQKAFASRVSADIFGYCGDAYYPPMILRQVIDQVDNGLLFDDRLGASDRHTIVVQAFRRALEPRVDTPIRSFSLFHAGREGDGMKCTFRLWEVIYNHTNGRWSDYEHEISGDKSYLVHLDGTGRPTIESKSRDWMRTEAKGTSRAAIGAFCDALHSGKDPFSGGPPQLVGIWRIGPARPFGFLWNGKKYLAGLEVIGEAIWQAVPWFNHLFERCDGKTGKRLKSAQRHPRPSF